MEKLESDSHTTDIETIPSIQRGLVIQPIQNTGVGKTKLKKSLNRESEFRFR